MILTERQQQIKDNYSRVLESISDAAAKAGRSEDSITLLAATKTVCAEDILFAVDSLGITHIGENRTEEMCAKFDALRGHAKIHQIGTLQRRKVRTIADKADLIESVDSIPGSPPRSTSASARSDGRSPFWSR